MKYYRIIPRLDIKGPNLVKGIHMEGLRVLGKPEDFAKLYYEHGADEIIYQDTVASLYRRNNITDVVSRTVKDIFIPLTVGGGIRTVNDIKSILSAGADKVAINTAIIEHPNLINQFSKVFGSSTIVAAIEAIKQSDGTYLAYTDNGREFTGVEVKKWACEVAERGAGEILLTSIDKEGTGKGFDLELIELVSEDIGIPIIAHGGAAISEHAINAINSGADAISMASMLHYSAISNYLDSSYHDEEGNNDFLSKDKKGFKMFGDIDLKNVKNQLLNNNFPVRIV